MTGSGSERRRRTGLVAFRVLPDQLAAAERTAAGEETTVGQLARAAFLRAIAASAPDAGSLQDDVGDIGADE